MSENKLELTSEGNLLRVRVEGKLTTEGYDAFVPAVDELIKEHGKLRILFEMHDFHGWTLGAMWDDFKFDLTHWSDIERLALVGESKWEKGMAVFCNPFTKAKIKYFDMADRESAEAWIAEN